MVNKVSNINLLQSAQVKPNAPKWVLDTVKEFKNRGQGTSAAIERLRLSPFFDERWIVKK